MNRLMRYLLLLVTLFGLFSCKNPSNRTIDTKESSTTLADSIATNTTGPLANSDPKHCDFDKFIADKTIPQLAKDIYLNKNWSLSNDKEALALLDSLTAENTSARPFYFKVVTMSHAKSDGYYSEALGLAGKEYVETNTKEFLSYFESKDCFSDLDLQTWAKIVVSEFGISEERDYGKAIVEDYLKKLLANCSDCTSVQKDILHKFGLVLEKEWSLFLKNTD